MSVYKLLDSAVDGAGDSMLQMPTTVGALLRKHRVAAGNIDIQSACLMFERPQ
jgi:hypothetical protein